MSTSDQVNIILMIKFVDNVATEQVAGSTGTNTPSGYVIRVAPHKVTHRTIMRHFLLAVEATDLIKSVDRRREASMYAEYLIIYYSCQCKIVKNLSAVAPYVY